MKKLISWLLLAALLCGCAPKEILPVEESTTAPPAAEEAAPQGLYSPGHDLETATDGVLRAYPLEGYRVSQVLPMGTDVLVVSLEQSRLRLVRLQGEALFPAVQDTLPVSCFLLSCWEEGLIFYDTQGKQTLLLDGNLTPVLTVADPEGMVGTPVLSRDGSTLFYCTADGVRALDTISGISRLLKQTPLREKTLEGLYLQDTVLECRYQDETQGSRKLYLSAHTGATLWEGSGDITLDAAGKQFYASFPNGYTQSHVFGLTGQEVQALLPREMEGHCVFLPLTHGAVTLKEGDSSSLLEHYALSTGQRSGALTLPEGWLPWDIFSTTDGFVWFLLYDRDNSRDILCRWDLKSTPTGDEASYTAAYFSSRKPDKEGLLACAEYAARIGEPYNIHIKIGKEAAAREPWDYDLEPEYRVELIWQELELLEQRLARYPEGFLQQLAFCGKSLSLCLVRSLRGSAESGSLDTAQGIQFWEDDHGFVVLAMGQTSEGALYHELCHIIDTMVLSYSDAYDNWDSLNPGDFEYDYDYVANQNRQSWEFLQDHSRSFVDMYSMSYPKEDRARILEYAMLEGNQGLFDAPVLQKKLRTICQGIREAFGLKKHPDPLPWEQYLQLPMV